MTLNMILILTLVLSLGSRPLWPSPEEIPVELPAHAITKPVVLDGLLDEDCWRREADLSELLVSFSPMFGTPLPYRTELWVGGDGENLYFAIKAHDPEPSLIKTSVTKRDNIDNDDWVGIALDPLGGRQSAYLFQVNPNGIQSDSHLTVAGVDPAADYVWFSAARIVPDGYCVEIRVPLKSIRYRSGRGITMNFMLQRHLARSSIRACWPQKRPSDSFLGVLGRVRFEELERLRQLELIPALTYGAIWDRLNPRQWTGVDDRIDFGVTAKYGITPAISAEATVNPDFSQVESDEFQILVNQRYPIFFQEKRPFFMESASLFNLAASDDSGDYNMFTAVHTRAIVDPQWGTKLTGEAGAAAFGLLLARDLWPKRVGSPADLFLIGRLKWSLGADNYAGILYTGRENGADANRVLALDFSYKLGGKHHFSAKAMLSGDRGGFGLDADEMAYTVSWGYYTKPLSTFLVLEHLGESFRMDTAFMLRSGMRRLMGYVAPSFYPRALPWLKRLNFMLWGYQVHDYRTLRDDSLAFIAMRAFFNQGASIRVDWRRFREHWQGKRLEGQYAFLFGQWQVSKRLFLYSSLEAGDKILYDETDPLTGSGLNVQFQTLFQPNDKLALEAGYIYERMKHPLTGLRLYNVHIVRGKLTVQINRYLFLRAIMQADSSQHIVLSDFLASFTLIPETVIQVGYGAAHQKMAWDGAEWRIDTTGSAYWQQRRSFFFKAGYRLQL